MGWRETREKRRIHKKAVIRRAISHYDPQGEAHLIMFRFMWQGLQETDASDVVQDDDTSEDQHLHISSREIGCRQGQARAEWGLKFIPFVDTSG